ncbi:MAG: hypothetical protein ACM31P_20005 [Actinomycetota bacterium]
MGAEIVTAVIGASGAVVLAGATYWFTKKREREAELRKEKLEHYKEFVASQSGIVGGDATPEGQKAFARACNNLNLIAPQSVLKALQAFQDEIGVSNPNPSRQRHDDLLSRLFYEIRKDLGISPGDDEASFKVGLWASGASPGGAVTAQGGIHEHS